MVLRVWHAVIRGFSGFLIWLDFLFKVVFSLGLGFCVLLLFYHCLGSV